MASSNVHLLKKILKCKKIKSFIKQQFLKGYSVNLDVSTSEAEVKKLLEYYHFLDEKQRSGHASRERCSENTQRNIEFSDFNKVALQIY